MADDGDGSRRSKRMLPSIAELINKSKELLGVGKRKRRAQHFELSTDPLTGLRSNTGTYSKRSRKGKKAANANATCEDLEEHVENFDAYCVEDQDCTSSACNAKPEMKDLLLDAQELMLKWQAGAPPRKQKWVDRQNLLNESWAESRRTLCETVLKAHFAIPEDSKCCRCVEKVAVVRCHECPSTKHLCSDCDQVVHRSWPFHDRDVMVNDHYLPIPPTTSKGSDGEWVFVGRGLPLSNILCPVCCSKCEPLEILIDSHCIVVTLKGRYDIHHQRYQCQRCHKMLSTADVDVVAQSGYWPGSIADTTYLFHQDLLLHWDILQKQIPGISERAFIKSLELFSKQKGRVATINAVTFGTAFKEWKFFQYELDKLRFIDWMTCPVCDISQHSVHVDGNMKLYRFKSAGGRRRECYYGDTFVVANDKVDSHIHKVYQGAKQRKSDEHGRCGDSTWRAAGNTLKKKCNLSETGLEIAGCRHALAQNAVNMFFGEVYGYAHYLQVNYHITKKVEYFWYDVVCKYWPWLKKHDKETSQKMKPALSVMHSKAHSWSCQTLWGGRWQKGAAATTGEEVEQINSHFSRLGSSTKHMLPEGREELLTEHAMKWNRRKIEGLPRSLSKRYTKAQSQLKHLHIELDGQLASLGLKRSGVSLEDWKKDVLLVATEEEASYGKKAQMTSDEATYLCHLLTLDKCTPKEKLLCEVADEMYGKKFRDLQANLSPNYDVGEVILVEKAKLHFQTQMERLHHSVSQLAFNMGKLSDGSKQRQKLRGKISNEKVRLTKTVDAYNKLYADNSVQLADIEAGNFPWKTELINEDGVPIRTKRTVVDKHMEVLRFQEEIDLLVNEMMAFMKFYKDTVLPSLDKEKEKLENLLKG